MFGKVKAAEDLPPACEGPKGDPWDEATLTWLANSDRLDFQVTHIEQRTSRGRGWTVRRSTPPFEAQASGYVPAAPQHVRLEVQFGTEGQSFGTGVLTWMSEERYRAGRVNIPILTLYLNDEDGGILAAMRDALAASICAGELTAHCRIFNEFADGWTDRSDEYYRLSFAVTDIMVWTFMKSPRLAEWAAPPTQGFWDMSTFDNPKRLRSTPARRS